MVFNLKSEGKFLLSSGHMEIILLLAYVSMRNHNQSYREWQTAQENFYGQKEPAGNNTTNMSPLIKSQISLSSSFSLKKQKENISREDLLPACSFVIVFKQKPIKECDMHKMWREMYFTAVCGLFFRRDIQDKRSWAGIVGISLCPLYRYSPPGFHHTRPAFSQILSFLCLCN